MQNLPSALSDFEEISYQITKRKPIFFFDFDGTLSPIVNDHTQATISDAMREKLETIAQQYPCGVVSGRGMKDVADKVGPIDNFYYVGSHGFEISGPENFHKQHEEATEQLSVLDEAETELRDKLKDLDNVNVERKKFAIAIHYRNAPEAVLPTLNKHLDEVISHYPFLKKAGGKKIFEFKPNVDWDKGKAIEFLMDELAFSRDSHVPVYLGDDLTDEDAFKVLVDDGIGILVGSHGEKTEAKFHLESVEEVGEFLDRIIKERTVKL